jgi:hypothetical protein
MHITSTTPYYFLFRVYISTTMPYYFHVRVYISATMPYNFHVRVYIGVLTWMLTVQFKRSNLRANQNSILFQFFPSCIVEFLYTKNPLLRTSNRKSDWLTRVPNVCFNLTQIVFVVYITNFKYHVEIMEKMIFKNGFVYLCLKRLLRQQFHVSRRFPLIIARTSNKRHNDHFYILNYGYRM